MAPPAAPLSPLSAPPRAVLDTNVVLDWLVFGNPACMALSEAIEVGRLHWVGTSAFRDELAHVLGRGVVDAWQPDSVRLWGQWDRWMVLLDPPPPTLTPSLTCTDPDDQKFIAFGLAEADWLLTRDRAVLKLARKAMRWGLKIATPEQWALASPASA